MNICYLENGIYKVNNEETPFEDLFTIQFYKNSNSLADAFYTGEVFDNILFANMIQKKLAIEFYLALNNVEKIEITEENIEIRNYTIDAAVSLGISVCGKNKKVSFIKQWIKMDGAMGYLFFKQLQNKYRNREVVFEKDVAVLRTPAAKGKIKKNDNREIFYEDSVGTGDFYTFFPLSTRNRCLQLAGREAKKSLTSLYDNLLKWGFNYSIPYILDFFTNRLVAAKFYQLLLRELFALPWKGRFISGNNLDLYALAEEEEAKKAGIDTICIPHGIEYGYKFPHCFTGNTFYTMSENAAKHLNNLYGTTKFVFNKEIVKEMFKVKSTKSLTERKIVYFSEPREPEVNVQIIKELLIHLADTKLFIKHHPKDNLSDYDEFNGKIDVIQDLSDAIQGNICLSRKSTTLLEGIYNDSICGAIIINEKDKAIFYNFPSLQDDDIEIFESIEEAASWAKRMINS